jgi:Thioredoxin-like
MRPKLVSCVLALFILWFQDVAQADSSNWLRGVGSQLEIRLRGEVFDVSGRPAMGVVVAGIVQSMKGKYPIVSKVDGHRFEAWVPVNQQAFRSVSFKASLNGDEQLAVKWLSSFELRQAAIDGVKLLLQVPTQKVQVKVIESGKPVARAKLIAGVSFGAEVPYITDEEGIVQLRLLPDQSLDRLTAWTDDFRIGGYGFDRTPAGDPKAREHVVELSPCRDLKMRFVDQAGAAVPSVDFALHVATPEPNYNFIGQTEHSRMKTDSNGEALYRWFPDWKAHYFYAESESESWYVDKEMEVVNDVVVFKMNRSKTAERKRITGSVRSSVTDVGGVCVSAQSFQGDREGYSDHLSAFADANGKFTVDVLPDATYCVFGIDSNWVTNIIDLIPYQSASERITSPELTLSEGKQVEISVTTGPDRKPFPNLIVSFESEYRYSWYEGKTKQNGSGSPRWFATTDEAGRIRTPANLGKLNVSVYTPLWQTRESHDVSMGQPTKITLHREVESKRKINGQLLLPDGLDAKLDDATITIGALGGSARDNQTLKSDSNGAFVFETLASPLGVIARTKDGRAAGMIVLKDQEGAVKLALQRTLDFSGQLLNAGGKPCVGVKVIAKVRAEGKKGNDDNHYVGSSFEALNLEAVTDQDGKYTIAGVPAKMRVNLSAELSSKSDNAKSIGRVWLEEDEPRPVMVTRIGDSEPVARTLATAFAEELRDSKLLGFPVMVILTDKSETASEFVNANFENYSSKPEVASYLQFVVARDKANLKESAANFLKEHQWQIPDAGRIFACVLDATGAELGRLEVDIVEKEAEEKVSAFVTKHLPAKLDAEEKWKEAFAEAKRTNRKVWARVSQRYCGPCFLLARWLDDHRELLEKDYVMLKIDDFADENGAGVAKRITRGGRFGIPFYAIFDTDKKLMVDSDSPLGNIGYPSGYEGSKHLRKMLLATRVSLTDFEVEKILATLGED